MARHAYVLKLITHLFLSRPFGKLYYIIYRTFKLTSNQGQIFDDRIFSINIISSGCLLKIWTSRKASEMHSISRGRRQASACSHTCCRLHFEEHEVFHVEL